MAEGVELLAARDGLVVVFFPDERPLGSLAPLVLLDGPHQLREGIAANSGETGCHAHTCQVYLLPLRRPHFSKDRRLGRR